MVMRESGRHTVAPYFIAKTRMPPESEDTWLAIVAAQEEVEDPVAVRRRMRGKMGIKMKVAVKSSTGVETEDVDSVEDIDQAVAEQLEDRGEWDNRMRQVLDDEGGLMLSDGDEVMELIFKRLVKLKQAVLPKDQDVLRTRIVSPQELLQEKDLWEKPIMEELT